MDSVFNWFFLPLQLVESKAKLLALFAQKYVWHLKRFPSGQSLCRARLAVVEAHSAHDAMIHINLLKGRFRKSGFQ